LRTSEISGRRVFAFAGKTQACCRFNTEDPAVELYEPSLDGELAAAERRLACA
jgi:hypothetical protein